MLNIKYQLEMLDENIFKSEISISKNKLIKILDSMTKNLESWEINEILNTILDNHKIVNYKWKRNFEWVMEEFLYDDARTKGIDRYYDEVWYYDYTIEKGEA